MLRLHKFGGPNDDTVSIDESKVESVDTVSSGPQVFCTVTMDSGNIHNVSEKEQEICDAIQAWKESSKAQP